MRLHRCYGSVEGRGLGVPVVEYLLRPAFPCLPVSDGASLLGRLPRVHSMSLQVAAREITYASAGEVQETGW